MKCSRVAGIVLGALLAVAATARPVRACGGFFCNRPPPDGTLPIAQAAENVLFVMDSSQSVPTVEAHIQILYTGPASEFSWIVPVTSVPSVRVGSDILFDRIEPPTRPSFAVNFVMEGNCQGVSGVGSGCGSAASGGANRAFGTVGGADGGVGVSVLSSGSTGPFEYVVVRSEDGATLRTWLTNNNYFVSPEGAQLIDDYVAGQHSFVALRLQRGLDTSAIRPIILRLAAVEACLPLKLTAIAATPDLRINVWVLASARAVPINYSEIRINLAKLDWFNLGRNYDQVLKDAANEANGNAFAVEYARPGGDSAAWFTLPTTTGRVQLEAATTPPAFLSTLSSLGLQPIGAVLQVLRKHIPIPASLSATGTTEAMFYANISTFWSNNRTLFAPFDPVAAAADMDADVLTPMEDYRTLFQQSSGKLTRLATFISPEEMTADPLFVPNPSLPDVAPQHMAVARVMCGDGAQACDSPVRLLTEDGREVGYRPTTCMQYERGDLDLMPAADVAFQRDAEGEGRIVVDNRDAIAAMVRARNAGINFPKESGGCGCATGGSPGIMMMLLLAAGGFALVRRSRRRG